MAPPPVSITTGIPERERPMGLVTPLVRQVDNPDTTQLVLALQTSLELEDLLEIFRREITEFVACDGIGFREGTRGVALQSGHPARHSANYALTLMGTHLGEISFTRRRRFGEAELALLEKLMCHFIYPLRNALLYFDAVTSALRDPLTGLGNRAALDRALDREIRLSKRQDMPLALIVGDVDRFKQINDNHGHAAGDRLLQTVAKKLEDALRGSDMAFRFGGEEFVVLLSNTGEEGALQVAERIRTAVATGRCDCGEAEVGVTISLGGAVLRDDRADLFDRADRALYRAKAEGRNRTVMADD